MHKSGLALYWPHLNMKILMQFVLYCLLFFMIKLIHFLCLLYSFMVLRALALITLVNFGFSFQQESVLGSDWRNIKGQVLASGNGSRQQSRKPFIDSSPSDSKSTEASTSMSVDELGVVDSGSVPSTSRAAEVKVKVKNCNLKSITIILL